VIVGTQTLEQSLDLMRPPARFGCGPCCVLLRHLGRLHRHRANTILTAFLLEPGDWNGRVMAEGRPPRCKFRRSEQSEAASRAFFQAPTSDGNVWLITPGRCGTNPLAVSHPQSRRQLASLGPSRHLMRPEGGVQPSWPLCGVRWALSI
jgi:hypothetical protein